MLLDDLPSDLAIHMLDEWIDTRVLARLDTACSNHFIRPHLMGLMQFVGCDLSPFRGNQRPRNIKLVSAISLMGHWVTRRGLHPREWSTSSMYEFISIKTDRLAMFHCAGSIPKDTSFHSLLRNSRNIRHFIVIDKQLHLVTELYPHPETVTRLTIRSCCSVPETLFGTIEQFKNCLDLTIDLGTTLVTFFHDDYVKRWIQFVQQSKNAIQHLRLNHKCGELILNTATKTLQLSNIREPFGFGYAAEQFDFLFAEIEFAECVAACAKGFAVSIVSTDIPSPLLARFLSHLKNGGCLVVDVHSV